MWQQGSVTVRCLQNLISISQVKENMLPEQHKKGISFFFPSRAKDTVGHPCMTPQDSSYPVLRDLFVCCWGNRDITL